MLMVWLYFTRVMRLLGGEFKAENEKIVQIGLGHWVLERSRDGVRYSADRPRSVSSEGVGITPVYPFPAQVT